ncbi:MAG: hypothetical protein EKK48_29910 [Candidatus Melainabacteria bacterium]|nr:MAG: hypothetical protein EKK48_29910 [Candidatus Melainabacteria bacterium]
MKTDPLADLERLANLKEKIRNAHIEYMIAISVRKVAYSKIIQESESTSNEIITELALRNAQYELMETLNSEDFERHKAMFQAHNHNWAVRELTALRNCFAGALFVDLDNLIKGLSSIVNKQCAEANIGIEPVKHKQAGRAITNNVRLGAAIWAAGNNFRHFENWPGTPDVQPERTAIGSINILRDLLDFECFNWNVCGEVLALIAKGRSVEQLFEDFQQIGRDLCDVPLQTLDKHTERLLIQVKSEGLVNEEHQKMLAANSI